MNRTALATCANAFRQECWCLISLNFSSCEYSSPSYTHKSERLCTHTTFTCWPAQDITKKVYSSRFKFEIVTTKHHAHDQGWEWEELGRRRSSHGYAMGTQQKGEEEGQCRFTCKPEGRWWSAETRELCFITLAYNCCRVSL
jgi:hypothetical protein